MNNFWKYISALLMGVITGVFVWEKIDNPDTIIKGKIRIKQGGRGNVQSPKIDAVYKPEKALKKDRSIKKAARKIKRETRRNNRKQKRQS